MIVVISGPCLAARNPVPGWWEDESRCEARTLACQEGSQVSHSWSVTVRLEGKCLLPASPLSLSSAHSGSTLLSSQVECDMEEESQVEDSDLGVSAGPVLSSISCGTSDEFVYSV